MTFKLEDKYPDRVIASDDNYPRGRFKNRTSPNSEDGSYLEQVWKNDERAFPDAILKNAAVTPNGKVDTPNACQVYDALMQIIDSKIQVATTTMYAVASGSANTITAQYDRSVVLKNGMHVYLRANGANTIQNPTFAPNSLQAKAIVKGNNVPLMFGDIAGAGYVCELMFDEAFDRWILLNPAWGVSQPDSVPLGTISIITQSVTPSGWLFIDDTDHLRSEYADFIQLCPEYIQTGSSSSYFKLIDIRGYFPRAWDGGRGVDTGRALYSIQDDAIRNITGQVTSNFNQHPFSEADKGATQLGALRFSSYGGCRASDTNYDGGAAMGLSFDASRQVPTAKENRPKNIAYPYYIKAK